MPPPDDRTAKARIRDAAILLVATQGNAALTARAVATAADVSPALVTHHYGSMDGLEEACDHHVAAVIRDEKSRAMAAGPGLDPMQALRDADRGPLVAYLAARLSQDSPTVDHLVDEMVDDAEAYVAEGIANGMLRPTDDVRGRATVLVMWSLGAVVLHRHVERLLGVDITDPTFGRTPDAADYAMPAFEMLSEGIFTPEFADHALAALRGASSPTA